MPSAIRIVVFVSLAVGFVAPAAIAQDADTGRFVTGPLTWTPVLALREAGVDSNVFNTPGDSRQDVGGTAAAQVNSTLTLGILQAVTQGSVEYMYFDRFTSERGVNRRVTSRLNFPVTRFSPDVALSWARVKERSGNEIDVRAPHEEWGYILGLQTRITPRVALLAGAGKQAWVYEKGFTFRDVEIANQLDRHSILANIESRLTVTPFTTFVAAASAQRDDFTFRPLAATDNIRVSGGFEFAPDAVIRGSAQVGYHSMKPRHGGVSTTLAAAFGGVTSSVDMSYTLLGSTRFSGRLSRDSNYSISTGQPYYLSTVGGLDVVQPLVGPVDLSVRALREKLDYPATDAAAARVDYAETFGGGLSIRLGTQVVTSLIYDFSQRRSSAGRDFEYDRRRAYTTVTYGF